MKLIKFYTKTCGPCKAMKPVVDKLVANHPEIEYEEIDCTNEVPDEWVQSIRHVPTILIIKEDKSIEKIVGIKTYEYLESML